MSHKIQHLVLAQFAGHGVFLLNGTYPPEALNYMVEYKTMHTVLCWLWQLCIQVGGAIVSVCFWTSGILNLKKAGAAGFEYSYSILSLCSWKTF